MKLLKYSFIFITIFFSLFLSGCQNKDLIQPKVMQDIYKTGGNLSFNYDETTHTIIFGGEDEIIQFYQEDIARGWNEKGCRIGFQMIVPKEVEDFKSGSANLDGEELLPTQYIDLHEGQTLVATFQPIVTPQKSNLTLKIKWEDGKNEQVYHIVIKKGTLFMDNNTETI